MEKLENFIPLISQSKLFSTLNSREVSTIIHCLSATVKDYDKGEYIFRFGDQISSIGLVLLGSIHIVKEDYWGNKTIFSEISTGTTFGESYACTNNIPISLNAITSQKSTIMFIDIKKITGICPSACTFHTKMIINLIELLADTNIMLTGKIEHISQRTTKDKILSYLLEQSHKNESNHFEIPFNRQQLADFLSVDRSAMSHELCKLRDDGILKFARNHFELIPNLN